MKKLGLLLTACATFLAGLPAARAEQCLVIGDSLTKEYEAEFPGLFPRNPASWQARNWIEILHQHRTDWFDTGAWSGYFDPRATGHKYNWALPGATTTEMRNILWNGWWTGGFENQIRNDAERVVIFAGGNDADSYYANLYNGLVGPEVTNTTLANIQWMVDRVRTVRANIPIVLVSVPHVGCSPKVQQGYPTDPVKTGRVTAAMDQLNASLAAFAQSRGIGFVPGVYEMTKALITAPFYIHGIEFYRVADADSRPRYVFSGDGFHPNTCAHARIAQMVVAEFNRVYPSTAIAPLTDAYLVTQVLGLDAATPYQEWAAASGQTGAFDQDSDGDGVANGLEFALNGAPPPQPVAHNGTLTLSYQPNPIFQQWGRLWPQYSTNLVNWTDVPASQVITNSDGSVTVSATFLGQGFLRLQASP